MPSTGSVERFEQVISSLRQGKVAPVYCVYGPQRWLMGQVVDRVREAVLQGPGGSLNHDRFLADEVEVPVVIDALNTVPMLGRMRLVEVGAVEKWSAQQMAQLDPLLSDLPEHGCLLLTAENLDGRLRVVKQMARVGVVLKAEPPDRRQLKTFLGKAAAHHRVRLGPGASDLLLELVGKDMGALVSALEKACLFAGKRGTLTEKDIRAVVADTRQAIIFELTDAVGARALSTALSALRRLIADREPPQRVLVMLARQVRLLWMARSALDQGIPLGRLASHMEVHSFVAQKLAGQVGAFTARELRTAHRVVAQADRSLKFSKVDSLMVLEDVILKICARSRA